MPSVWVAADQGVVSLASFVATAIVGRFCGPYELGIFGLATFIFWLSASIPNAIVWTPYTSRAPRLTMARRRVFAGSATLHVTGVAFLIAVGFWIAAAIPTPRTRQAEWFVPMCLALAPFSVMMIAREHVRRLALAHLQTRDLLAVDVPIAILQIAILLLLAQLGLLMAPTAILAVGIASGGAALWLVANRDRFRFDGRRAVMHWRTNQRFGRWLLFVSVMWLLGDAFYRLVVGELHGLAPLGQFTAAQNIVLCVNPLLLTITNLTQSHSANRYSRGGMEPLRQFALTSTILLGGVGAVAFICLAVIGGPLVELVFGGHYAGLGPVVVSLCLGTFARMVTLPIDGAMVALARGRIMLVAGMVRLVLIIAAGLPLIAWLGIVGVGYAMALSSVGAAAVQWWSLLGRHGDA
jgi:O-antigen/teichoic acid export membrane protein